MNRQIYPERPLDNEEVRSIGIITEIIRFDIHEVEQDFECDEVEYNHKEDLSPSDYGPMVSCIIRGKYSEDAVEAILNNYLSDPTNKRYEAEFNMLQSWRAEAKERARSILGLLEE